MAKRTEKPTFGTHTKGFSTIKVENNVKKIWVSSSYSDKGLYYSLDGKTWTQSNITSGNFHTVYYSKINDDNVGLIIKYQDIISSYLLSKDN